MSLLRGLWRSYHLRHALLAGAVSGALMLVAAIAVDLSYTRATPGAARWAIAELFLLSLPPLMLVNGAIAYFLSYRAMLPLREMQATAKGISARGLDRRIPEGAHDVEFDGVITVFNEMLERLERGFDQANEFSAGAAHELKTPLAVLQGELERGVQEAEMGSDEQARYGRLLNQVQRLKTVTHRLLLLATVDAGGLRLHKAPLDLSECVQDACEDAGILAPDIIISKKIPSDVIIQADGVLLPQVITNLVTNAVTHNKPGGRMGMTLTDSRNAVTLTISNTGPGIPEADRARLFKRFYRADKSRSRARGGSGLGLSLARDLARAHGGDIFLVTSEAGVTTFRLVLPK